MARLPKRFADETLWPEFLQISDALDRYLESVTNRVIKAAIFPDAADAETCAAPEALADLRDDRPRAAQIKKGGSSAKSVGDFDADWRGHGCVFQGMAGQINGGL